MPATISCARSPRGWTRCDARATRWRLGGDEFALLLEGASETQAVKVSERVLGLVSEPVSVAGRELSVSASVGIVIHPGGRGESTSLIRDADVAMYAAKESG